MHPKFDSRWSEIVNSVVKHNGEITEYGANHNSELSIVRPFFSSTIERRFSEWLNFSQIQNHRSREKSAKYREDGNILYRKGLVFYTQAIVFYTNAIIYAPKNSLECAQAHYNRALSLAGLKYLEEAYDDCECAKRNGHDKLDKVLNRQLHIAIGLSSIDKVTATSKELEKIKAEIKLSEEDQEKVLKLYESRSVIEIFPNESNKNPPEKQQKMYVASNAGRFVQADETISKNEIIFTEKAFAFVPIYSHLSDNELDHNCQNCAKANCIPFPCYECVSVSYCSTKCRLMHEKIHKFECKGYSINLWASIGVGFLAFRTMLTGISNLFQSITAVKSNRPEDVWEYITKIYTMEKTDYASIIRLETNLKNIRSDDALKYGITAAMLSCYLTDNTSFFDDIPEDCFTIMPSYTEWQLIVGALILRHITQMICNAHSITEMTETNFMLRSCIKYKNHLNMGKLHAHARKRMIFAAIYPRVSLYNHSCEPNIRNRFNRSKLTIIAAQNFEKGDEIFNNYGIHYMKMQKNERIEKLRAQYGFVCDCKHCTSGKDDEYLKFHTYICQKCKEDFKPKAKHLRWYVNEIDIECTRCGSVFNCEWYRHFMHTYNKEKIATTETCLALCDIYEKSIKMLSKYNVVKQKMALLILDKYLFDLSTTGRLFGVNSDKLYGNLMNIALDYLNAVEAQSGYPGLDYIEAATYVLDMVAIRSVVYNMNTCSKNILIKIQKSFEILSDDMRTVFDNYFEYYITDREEKEC